MYNICMFLLWDPNFCQMSVWSPRRWCLLGPSDQFFYFSFPSYSRFCKGPIRILTSGIAVVPSWLKNDSLKWKNSLHPRHIWHWNTKTAQCKLSKNHWVSAFFKNFGSVREILQFTVFLDHPVEGLKKVFQSFHGRTVLWGYFLDTFFEMHACFLWTYFGFNNGPSV